MFKKRKKLACIVGAITTLSVVLTGCGKQEPRDVVSDAFENTFTSVSGFKEITEGSGYLDFADSAFDGAIDVDAKLNLTKLDGVGEYGSLIASLSPQINIGYGLDYSNFAGSLDLGVLVDSLNIDLNGSAYLDTEKAVFGVPGVSKMYSVDLSSLMGDKYETFKDSFSSYSQYMSSASNMGESIKNHFSNDYDEAWELCSVESTGETKSFTLSNGREAKCDEYIVYVTPESVESFINTFFDYLQTDETIKDLILSNPAAKIEMSITGQSEEEYCDEIFSSLDDTYDEIMEDFNTDDEPCPVKIYIQDNKIRSISLENENDEAFLLTTLGSEYPFDDTVFSFSEDDEEVFNIKFKTEKLDTIDYLLNISIAEVADDCITLEYNYDPDSGKVTFNGEMSADGAALSIDCEAITTVVEEGKSVKIDLEDLDLSFNSAAEDISVGLTGEINMNIVDSIDVPEADTVISSEEEISDAFREIRRDVMSSLDLSSIMSLFQ